MDENWDPGTMYIRHIDKEKRSHIQEHACWNMRKFLASTQAAALEAGGRVEQCTRAEYLASKQR